MDLAHALRLDISAASPQTISLVGAGGKTTALFQIARAMLTKRSTVIVTATAHLGVWQTAYADHHISIESLAALKERFNQELTGIVLITGPVERDRTKAIDENALLWLHDNLKERNIPLLIEADGARGHPLKAPATHEPNIPTFTDIVVVVAGLSALGKPLNGETIHRPEVFSQITQTPMSSIIAPEDILRMLMHPQGGLKNIPPAAHRIALLNQADSPEMESSGGSMAVPLLAKYDAVIVAALEKRNIQVIEHTAGIILAAGESKRFGDLKQLLDWHGKPFVRQVAETARQAGLWPVIVVTGFRAAEVAAALTDLPVKIANNPDFVQGQSTSIRIGLQALSTYKSIGAAIFLLADQPQIPPEVIRALTEAHSFELPAILAPLVLEERRANPVLFDRGAFSDLLKLTGDVGGRAIFDKYRVEYLPWYDDTLLFDVDKPEDYQRLQNLG